MNGALHVAIIMDGNGRWAAARGLPRTAGHKAGVESIERVLEAAPDLGIGTLTVYAFSSDNWRRPPEEIGTLFGLLESYLARETRRLIDEGVRLDFVGRRDRLPSALRSAIERAEARTARGSRLRFRVALDYSSRDALVDAAARMPKPPTRQDFTRLLGPDVDLLIRTGGEQRLSDFLLWECAYAEIVFTARMWPEFGRQDLATAIAEFHSRERRFGALPAA